MTHLEGLKLAGENLNVLLLAFKYLNILGPQLQTHDLMQSAFEERPWARGMILVLMEACFSATECRELTARSTAEYLCFLLRLVADGVAVAIHNCNYVEIIYDNQKVVGV